MVQQVGIFAVVVVRNAGARLAPDRLVPDFPAQALQPFAVYHHAMAALENGDYFECRIIFANPWWQCLREFSSLLNRTRGATK